MKYIKLWLLSLAALTFTAAITAQEAPATTEFEVDGLKVILRQSVKGTISARLFINGGTVNYIDEKQGVESMALSLVMQSGPAYMTKDEFNEEAESVGAQMGGSSGYDYANMSLNCLKLYWDKSWDLFAGAITTPAWREDDFKIIQNQMVTASRQARTNADVHLQNIAFGNAWRGTDYAKNPAGSPESLKSLTLDDLKKHYGKVVVKKNAFLVVVGDVSKEDLTKKIKQSLAKLPTGKAAKRPKTTTGVTTGVFIENRVMETNYILGVFDAPKRGTNEAIQNDLAMSILGDRFFEELRTKRSLSYAPAASRTGNITHPMNILYISTTDPVQSLEVMMDEVNKMRKEGFTEKELEGKKQSYLTNYFMGQESNASISMGLGVNEINGGWEKMDRYTQEILATTTDDLNKIMRKYGDKIFWTYLGKEELIKNENFTQPIPIKE